MTSDSVIKKIELQVLHTYNEWKQATVAEWVALQPLFEVCMKVLNLTSVFYLLHFYVYKSYHSIFLYQIYF